MPVIQSTYVDRMVEGICGQIADMRAADTITKQCEGTAGIPFGRAVSRGTDPATQAVIGGTLTDFLGASILDPTVINASGVAADLYTEKKNMGVLFSGSIFVECTGSPTADDPVHFNATTGVFAASGGSGPVLGARWMGVKFTDPNGKTVCKCHFGAYNQAG